MCIFLTTACNIIAISSTGLKASTNELQYYAVSGADPCPENLGQTCISQAPAHLVYKVHVHIVSG